MQIKTEGIGIKTTAMISFDFKQRMWVQKCIKKNIRQHLLGLELEQGDKRRDKK